MSLTSLVLTRSKRLLFNAHNKQKTFSEKDNLLQKFQDTTRTHTFKRSLSLSPFLNLSLLNQSLSFRAIHFKNLMQAQVSFLSLSLSFSRSFYKYHVCTAVRISIHSLVYRCSFTGISFEISLVYRCSKLRPAFFTNYYETEIMLVSCYWLNRCHFDAV